MAQRNFLGDPILDRIMFVVTNLAEELYVTQDRLNAIQNLLDERGIVTRADVENYQPSAKATDEAKQLRDQFVARLLDVAVGVEPRS